MTFPLVARKKVYGNAPSSQPTSALLEAKLSMRLGPLRITMLRAYYVKSGTTFTEQEFLVPSELMEQFLLLYVLIFIYFSISYL